MNTILAVLTIVLILAGAFTAREAGQSGLFVVSSLGLILLGMAVDRRSRR